MALSREALRKRQDEIIAYAKRRGLPDSTQISDELPGSPTIGQLKQFIHPAWESVIERVAKELKQERNPGRGKLTEKQIKAAQYEVIMRAIEKGRKIGSPPDPKQLYEVLERQRRERNPGMTPYQRLKKSGVKSTFYSPDGFSKIEEFDNGERYHHHPNYKFPIRMTPVSRKKNPSDDLGQYFVYYNGEFYYASSDDHYKHGRPVGNKWYPTMAEARAEAKKLNDKKGTNPRRTRRMMPIVANPELLLIGNPRRRRKSRRGRRRNGKLRLRAYRRRRRNGGPKGLRSPAMAARRVPKPRLHSRWKMVGAHRRRVNPKRRRGGGKYSSFVKKHKGLFKRMTFKQATKKIGQLWRKSH